MNQLLSGPYSVAARWIAGIVVLLAFGAACALKMHEHDQVAYDKLLAESAQFKGGVEALGTQAAANAARVDAKNKSDKEKADAQHSKVVTSNRAAIIRMRAATDAQYPGGSAVPAAPAGSRRPDLICFDRAEYFRTDGVFTQGARGLSDEGTASTIDLDTGKVWAQEK